MRITVGHIANILEQNGEEDDLEETTREEEGGEECEKYCYCYLRVH